MASKKSYNRFFIIFQEEDKGYGFGPDKPPTGYVKVEIKNDKCKVTVYVQNLRCLGDGEGKYKFYIICRQDSSEAAVCPGVVNIDEYGRGEAVWESSTDNAFNSMVSADKYNAAAIIVDKEGMHAITAPLAGYMSKDKFEFKSMIKIEPEVPERIEEAKAETVKETDGQVEPAGVKNKFDEYEREIGSIIENKNIVEENKKEETVEHNVEPEAEDRKRASETIKEQTVPEEPVDIKTDRNETAEPVREQTAREGTAESTREQTVPEEPVDIKTDRNETAEPVREQTISEGATESSREQIINEENIEPVREQIVQEKTAETIQEQVEAEIPVKGPIEAISDSVIRKIESEYADDGKYEDVDVIEEEMDMDVPTDGLYEEEFESGYTRGMCMYGQHKETCPYNTRNIMRKALEKILVNFSEMCKSDELKNTRMWKITLNKCMYMSCMMYMYPYYDLVFYPLMKTGKYNYYRHVMKHGYYLFGIKYDKNKCIKALVYGIPGKNEKCDQPYKGRTGFVKWVQVGKKGYWIMMYDPMTGMVLHP